MNTPFYINDELKELYLRYIATELPLKSKELLDERKVLFSQDGVINREPLIEMLPRYKSTKTMAKAIEELNLNPLFKSFVDCGLFSSDFKMYEHQYNALKSVCCDQKNMVITTGTGSGKTESFLFPLLHNIIEESKHWKNGKTPAIRGLLLYPLNALAEDQMVRLRKSLDSVGTGGAREWFQKYLNSEKITFGRYTGKTPVAGKPSSNKKRDLREERINLERTFRSIENHKDQDLRYNFPSMDKSSSEIFDRWTMQDTPPDLLITNYSMLNVMLMRTLEASMFDDTKQWLENDPWLIDNSIKEPTRVFHLVVDELHTYRGTAGTEVAYL